MSFCGLITKILQMPLYENKINLYAPIKMSAISTPAFINYSVTNEIAYRRTVERSGTEVMSQVLHAGWCWLPVCQQGETRRRTGPTFGLPQLSAFTHYILGADGFCRQDAFIVHVLCFSVRINKKWLILFFIRKKKKTQHMIIWLL